MQCLVYWEGGTNISSIPSGVTVVAAAFGGISGHSITQADLGMGTSMSSDISALHAKGIKVVLSLGGAGGSFSFDGNTAGFQSSLKSAMQTYGYDGVDFDDENGDVTQRVSDLTTLIPAAAQVAGLVTYAVYGDTSTGGDGTVLQKVASSVSLLNVMSYAGSDVSTTEQYVTNYASYMSKNKTLLGLDYGGDLGGVPSTSALQQMASWVKSSGYGGIMIWEAGSAGSSMPTVLTDLGM
jgi:hypothetical protein